MLVQRICMSVQTGCMFVQMGCMFVETTCMLVQGSCMRVESTCMLVEGSCMFGGIEGSEADAEGGDHAGSRRVDRGIAGRLIVAPLTLREDVSRRQALASAGHGLGAW